MNLHTTISRKHWLTLMTVIAAATLLLTTGILFAANQTPRPDAIALQGLPAPEQGRIFAQPDDVQEDFELPPVEKEPLTYPNMDSHLNRLVEETESTRRETTSDAEQTTQSVEPVLVTFYVLPEHINALREYLEANGVFVRNVGDDYIEAHVPLLLLSPASEQPGVLRVDTVIPPRSTQSRDRVISQGVGLHGADAWHNADYRGRNVKVGVIDSGFEGFSQLEGGELPNNVTARCYFDGPQTPSSRLADCEVEGNHGTAVAETVVDVAPDIELYISNPYSLGDLRNAVDWMVGQGVQIINVSLGYPYDGPGDGTSPDSDSPLRTIDAAVSNGITWINSGGNDAQNAWYGTFHDPINEGIHHWSGDRDLGNTFALHEGETFAIFMRWDDNWGQADCDLDLLLFKSQRDADGRYPLVGRDITPQDGSPGSIPLAGLISRGEISASQAGVYFLAIIKAETCTDDPAWIQLTAWIDGVLQYHSPGHHMGNPEESRNSGMLAVGATHYWNTSTIAAYSSQGPTMDGRTKPDITGIACGRTVVVPPVADDGGQCWFRGTSQAAPHVAGLAALIRQRFPDYGPRETVSYLQQHASDRGTAGADNTWGHGLATLPAPEVAPISPTGNIAVRAGVNAGEVVISWDAIPEATYYRVGYVNMVTDYPLATASVTGEWIEAFVYVDVNALNLTVNGGRVEYTVRRLAPARHAFTVLTSNDVVNTAEYSSGRYNWPRNPRWRFHTVGQ
jgi:subtilisin family serine protease